MQHTLNVPLRYSRVIPFLIDFSGNRGETHTIWTPGGGAVFELARMTIRSNVIADLNVCDTDPSLPVLFVSLTGVSYNEVGIGPGTIRSVSPSNSHLLLMDPVGVAMAVKGIVYGYEVDPQGIIR